MEFMKILDSQIPVSKSNWLDFNMLNVTKKLRLLDKPTTLQIKSIKSLGKIDENVFAPFCIIFGYNVHH